MKDKDPIKVIRKFVSRIFDSSEPIYIGIDPGASGAIGFLCELHYAVISIPILKVPRGKGKKSKNKTVFNLPKIISIFQLLKKSSKKKHAIIEEGTVGIPGKGNSAYNGFRVGCNSCMWALFILSQGITIDSIRPTQWKRKLGLHGKNKDASRKMAIKRFPKAPLSRKKDHDRAEAILLAQFLKRNRNKGFFHD